MSAEVEQEIVEFTEKLLRPAATLFAVQKMKGDNVREETKRVYGRMVDAHLLITGVLVQ